MKKIVIMLVFLLSACTNINFDALEYDRYITIKENADNSILLCSSPDLLISISDLKKEMDHQYLYSVNRVYRPQVYSAAKNLKALVDGMYFRTKQGNPSVTYCEDKLHHVSGSADTMIKVLGRM